MSDLKKFWIEDNHKQTFGNKTKIASKKTLEILFNKVQTFYSKKAC